MAAGTTILVDDDADGVKTHRSLNPVAELVGRRSLAQTRAREGGGGGTRGVLSGLCGFGVVVGFGFLGGSCGEERVEETTEPPSRRYGLLHFLEIVVNLEGPRF